MASLRSIPLIVLASAGSCLGQAALEIRVLNIASPGKPTVELQVWAHFPLADYALDAVVLSLDAQDPAFFVEGSCGGVQSILEIEPLRISGVAGQGHFPPSTLADPSNPICLFRAAWRAEEFTARLVEIQTRTTHFSVYPSRESERSESRLDGLIEGHAFIEVRDSDCYPDCDQSGALDFFDFLCFQDLFAAGDPAADCDQSGGHDFFDFLCFQNAFAAGCS